MRSLACRGLWYEIKQGKKKNRREKVPPLLCTLLVCLFNLQVIFLKVITKDALNLGCLILNTSTKKLPVTCTEEEMWEFDRHHNNLQ